MIGYLEPHARAETEAQADGLPRLGRRRVPYRDVVMRSSTCRPSWPAALSWC
jgi:K+-sensing histidine kinase KdpD